VSVEAEIQEREAWGRLEASALVARFHPDMVWPWPSDGQAHDPARWVFPQGRFDRARWQAEREELSRTREFARARRHTVRIEVSAEGDGDFAVVNVETRRRRRADGERVCWRGRERKGNTKVGDRRLPIFHPGLLEYGGNRGR